MRVNDFINKNSVYEKFVSFWVYTTTKDDTGLDVMSWINWIRVHAGEELSECQNLEVEEVVQEDLREKGLWISFDLKGEWDVVQDSGQL